MSTPERKLLLYFLQEYKAHLVSQGCNDMPHNVLVDAAGGDLLYLYEDFLIWDHMTNPEGWSPVKLNQIQDFMWFDYLAAKLSRSL